MTLPRITRTQILQLNNAELPNAFELFGCHRDDHAAIVNAFAPGASKVWLCNRQGDDIVAMTREDASGVFTSGPIAPDLADYRFRVEHDGGSRYVEDPYRFASLLRDDDVWLFAEGRHEQAWQFLGANVVTCDGVAGVQFALWAPNARRVAVVGDFNHFDARTHVLRFHPGCGIWEMFVPGPGIGASYRFDMIDAHGQRRQKADPYAKAMLHPADAVGLVANSAFDWGDARWLGERASSAARPISVYEVHAGSWRRNEDGSTLSYADLSEALLDYVVDLGFTHVQFLPLTEHPFTGSWGYQPIGLFAPTVRHGSPDAFRAFVNRAHQRGIGVILDWVPAHFPGDEHGLTRFDGTALYEHADTRQGVHPDWDTLIFNYGRAEVINYLVSNAMYWLEEFHIDGLRVDAVASMLYLDYSREEGDWLPNAHGGRENLEAIAILRRVNEAIRSKHPGVLAIAEESTAFPGVTAPVTQNGLGFGYKWNMGWMHDTLSYMAREPVHRAHHHNEITFSMAYAYTERFMLPLSHDEVVHGKGSLLGKMPGDEWQRLANLRALLAYMWAHPGKKLLFMGCELAQTTEWNHDASVDWSLLQHPRHRGMQQLVRDLNARYTELPALYRADDEPRGFQWLDVTDSERSVLSFQRNGGANDAPLVVCVNLTPVVREDYLLQVPAPGSYREVLNTDSEHYGGSNVGNLGVLATTMHGDRHLLRAVLPPLAAIYMQQA